MEYFVSFSARYLRPTAYKGARVAIINNHTGDRNIVPYDYEYSNIEKQAAAWIKDNTLYKPMSYTVRNNEIIIIVNPKNKP